MKKGLVVGGIVVLAFVAGAVTFLAKNNLQAPSGGTETSAELAASAPAPTPAAAPTPPPETATATPAAPMSTPVPEAAPAPAQTADATPAPAADQAAATAPAAGDAVPDIDMSVATADRVMGKDDAPVTVIEYASLSCPHCAAFATTILPEVKAKLIDTGKLKLIFRDFPLDQHAMNAAKMARCAPVDKYFDLIEVIFKNRDRWLANADPEKGLRQLGALAGMNETYMQNCMGSAELENAILRGVSDAQSKFAVKATPTFVFNYGVESFSGEQDEAKFEDVVNRLTVKK